MDLDNAFGAAAAAMATARGERAGELPEMRELESLFKRLPDFERLVNVAANEAEDSARIAGAELWRCFGLNSAPPRWSDGERARARLLVACACAPVDGQGAMWLRPRLLKLAADRWAALIVEELRKRNPDCADLCDAERR